MNNSFNFRINVFKKHLILIAFFSFNVFFAQTTKTPFLINNTLLENSVNNILVLEKPHFTSPEKQALFFFSETYFFDFDNYFGKVKEVEKVHSVYNQVQQIISSDAVFFESKNQYLINSDISTKPIKDLIGIDSVSKKTDTIQLFHFDKEASHVYQIYELKNEQIINSSENTSTLYYTTDYNYNKKQQLIKIVTIDDYGATKIELANYNENGMLISKQSFDTNNGINVKTILYSYKNNLLIKVERNEVFYAMPFDLEETSIDKIDYTKYQNNETFINLKTVNFEYNQINKLVKVAEISTGFSEKDGVHYKNEKTYSLTYQTNKVIVHAILPQKKTYEYFFDTFKNPKEINLYVVEKDRTWLHKKTTFKILYDE